MSAAWLGDESEEEADQPFQVNEEFAARLEHNKRREESHRLQAKHDHRQGYATLKRKAAAEPAPVEASESSSEDDEEDDWEEDEAAQRQLLETISRIRNKDSAIYDPAVQLQPDDSDDAQTEDAGAAAPKAKKQRAMRLAEINMREAMAGPDAEDGRAPRPDTYQGELQNLKSQFLEAAGDAETPAESDRQDEDLLKKRDMPGSASLAAASQPVAGRPSGPLDTGDPEDAFLQRFILTQGWRDQDDRDGPGYGDLLKDVEEEEEQLQREEHFEAKYNFRFEEPGANKVVTFPRQLGNSVRKPDDRRKKQRESHEQNKQAAKQEAGMEVKRLKNLKKQELQDSLSKLQDAFGGAGPSEAVLSKLLAADFDPDDYDKLMAGAFNDDYYEAEGDEGPDTGADSGDDNGSAEAEAEPETFKAARARIKQSHGAASADGAAAAAVERDSVLRLLDEYQGLDFEDKIGDVACRFRYRDVPAIDSGLRADQILGTSDKDLNQVLGMKRLAAYRDDRRGMRPNFQKINEIRRQKRDTAPDRSFKKDRSDGRSKKVKHADATHNAPGTDMQQQTQGDVHSAAQIHGNNETVQDAAGSAQQQPPQQQHRKKSKRQDRDSAADKADPAAQRMQSYAKLTLKRSSDGKTKITKQHAPSLPPKPAADVVSNLSNLTKAQKRNKRRAARRAEETKPEKS